MERSEKRGNGRRVIVGRGMVKRSEEKGNGGRSFRRGRMRRVGGGGRERGSEMEERRELKGRGPGLEAREIWLAPHDERSVRWPCTMNVRNEPVHEFFCIRIGNKFVKFC